MFIVHRGIPHAGHFLTYKCKLSKSIRVCARPAPVICVQILREDPPVVQQGNAVSALGSCELPKGCRISVDPVQQMVQGLSMYAVPGLAVTDP
ncbi:hypothetical protein FA13DRAFT_207767 [Coprinellus micaceus]|uniref:Uncharacterized protein n=1 Tax=Coprinellus micaceus TaxID=71717 RepID=A0A4Y7SH58_COPMI|nr:hypothetical protein FA13DRAFT_207767 [Coprinellus micaceus]